MKRPVTAAVLALLIAACERATPRGTVFGKASDRIVRLPTGDSVEWQLTLPASVDGFPPGLLVEFFPFRSMDDTVALRTAALGLFPVAARELKPRNPAFIVLRAVSLPAKGRTGIYKIQNYGFVFDHPSDGHWYRLRDSIPIM